MEARHDALLGETFGNLADVAHVIDRDDLGRNERATGSPRDLAGLEPPHDVR